MNARRITTVVGLPALAALALSGSHASAAITSVTGNTTWLGSPPAACGFGQLTGINAYTWDEQLNVSGAFFADMTNNPGSSASPIPGVIGGSFDSHFIHFDGIPGVIGASGTVTFNGPIIGVIFYATSLDNTDAPLGAFGTVYPTGYPFRGINTTMPSSCSILGNTITFSLANISPVGEVAQIRVLTHSVPAPGAPAALALAGLLVARRRRRA